MPSVPGTTVSTGRAFPTSVAAPVLLESLKITGRVRPTLLIHRVQALLRDLIGQAKGILMERQRLSAGDAFDLLRRASQRLNRKLIDVAEHLTETGEMPG